MDNFKAGMKIYHAKIHYDGSPIIQEATIEKVTSKMVFFTNNDIDYCSQILKTDNRLSTTKQEAMAKLMESVQHRREKLVTDINYLDKVLCAITAFNYDEVDNEG